MYVINVATPGAYAFRMESTEFDTELELRSVDLKELARNDDIGFSRTNSGFRAFLATGTYILFASSSKLVAGGQYAVSYSSASNEVEGCEDVFIVRGVITAQATTAGDCMVTQFALADRFTMYLEAGSPVTIQVDDDSYSGPNVEVTTPSGAMMRGTFTAPYVATLTFVAPVSGYYTLHVGLTNDYGSYYTLRTD
jgi:hypothetical protein